METVVFLSFRKPSKLLNGGNLLQKYNVWPVLWTDHCTWTKLERRVSFLELNNSPGVAHRTSTLISSKPWNRAFPHIFLKWSAQMIVRSWFSRWFYLYLPNVGFEAKGMQLKTTFLIINTCRVHVDANFSMLVVYFGQKSIIYLKYSIEKSTIPLFFIFKQYCLFQSGN